MIHVIVDFGLLVLIWMVQLVVYPSFLHFSNHDLLKWHPIYTKAIAMIVVPLMVGQLGLYAYLVLIQKEYMHVAALALVLMAWAVTFFIAVPLHGKINEGNNARLSATKLVQINWIRTVIWTIVFLSSISQYYY